MGFRGVLLLLLFASVRSSRLTTRHNYSGLPAPSPARWMAGGGVGGEREEAGWNAKGMELGVGWEILRLWRQI